jgi:hypothetical protein
MGDKLTLRSLFFLTAISAILFMVVRLALVSRGENAVAAIMVFVLIPCVTFTLFALAFLVLLPFGIIAAMARESTIPGTSPFADDGLPTQQISTIDPERAN